MKKILDAVKEDLKLKEKEKFKDCGFYDEKEKPLLNLDSKNINNPELGMQYYQQQFLGDCWLIAAFGILNKKLIECELTTGNYLIVPMSFKYWQQRGKIVKYNLSVQSLRSIDLKQVKFKSSLLSHIIMKRCFLEKKAYEEEYLIKEIIDSDGNAFIYAIQMIVGKTDVTFILL